MCVLVASREKDSIISSKGALSFAISKSSLYRNCVLDLASLAALSVALMTSVAALATCHCCTRFLWVSTQMVVGQA